MVVRTGSCKSDREAVAREVVKHYTTRAMWVGGAAGLPAVIPGWGTVVAAVGGGLAELALLKFGKFGVRLYILSFAQRRRLPPNDNM